MLQHVIGQLFLLPITITPTQTAIMMNLIWVFLSLSAITEAFTPLQTVRLTSPTHLSARKQKVSYYKKLPVTLYRIQKTDVTTLREYESQMAKNRKSYDVTLDENGLVKVATGEEWIGPNGMSLRPATDSMLRIAQAFRGEQRVYRLDEGMELPDGLIVLHERDDHYSMQTTEPCTLEELNQKITNLIQEIGDYQTLDQFIDQLLDEEDQDN